MDHIEPVVQAFTEEVRRYLTLMHDNVDSHVIRVIADCLH